MVRRGGFLSLSTVIVLALVLPVCAHAQSQAEDTVCVAVFPCDDAGRLLPEFSAADSPCFAKFSAQCAQIRSQAERDQLFMAQIDRLQAENEALKKELQVLKRKLKIKALARKSS